MSEPGAQIEEIRLENFRAFENVRLRFDGLSFLVGRNGAGKSNLIDAIEFMREALTDSLPNALGRRDGFAGIVRRDAGPDAAVAIAVKARIAVGGTPVRVVYGFRLRNGGEDIEERFSLSHQQDLGFHRRNESMNSERYGGQAPTGRLALPVMVISQLQYIVVELIRRARGYAVDPFALCTPVSIGNTTSLEHRASNAADVIEDLREQRAFDPVKRALSAIVPGVTDVLVRPVLGRRVIYFVQRSKGVYRHFAANEMSQGTLRALGLLLALYQEPRPTLTMLDEIEDSLHPGALGVIIESARARSAEFPVVLTTHSPEVLSHAAATPDRIGIVQWDDGISRLFNLSEGTTQSVDAVTSVGDLLRHNALWPADAPSVFNGDVLALDE